jgi:hypothetical protein
VASKNASKKVASKKVKMASIKWYKKLSKIFY